MKKLVSFRNMYGFFSFVVRTSMFPEAGLEMELGRSGGTGLRVYDSE